MSKAALSNRDVKQVTYVRGLCNCKCFNNHIKKIKISKINFNRVLI